MERAKPLEDLLENMYGKTSYESKGLCPICKRKITPFRDELSENEYKISGMCQNCQDDFFE